MNNKRLGQFLIGGVFAVCGLVITALADVAKEERNSTTEETASEK